MRLKIFACLLGTLALSLLRAGPVEVAIVSAMKIADAPNYGWVSDIIDDARTYTIDGKTDLTRNKDFSLVTMPMVSTLRRGAGLGGGNSDNQATAIFKGDVDCVIETPEGWKRAEELEQIARDLRSRRNPGRTGSRGGGPRGNRGDAGTAPALAYSNLQKTLSRPHEEIGIIVAGYTDLKVETYGVSGALADTNARLLLVHAGQKNLTPLRATGTFRFWIKEGQLTKYQVTLEGTIAVATANGRREVQVHQTTTTTLREVGTTRFEIPEAARKILGG